MSSNTRGVDNNAMGDERGDHHAPASELPFLVTHWLANYSFETTQSSDHDRQGKDAVLRIRRAASEIASAFSDLGAYGTASRSLFAQEQPSSTEPSRLAALSVTRKATFSDVARRWPGVSANHLETVVQSSASNTVAVNAAADRDAPSSCLVESAYEVRSMPRDNAGGRRLGNATDDSTEELLVPSVASALQSPTLMAVFRGSPEGPSHNGVAGSKREGKHPRRDVHVPVESDFRTISQQSANCTRKVLSLRERHLEEEREMRQLKRSINNEQKTRDDLQKERDHVSSGQAENASFKQDDAPTSPRTRTAVEIASKDLAAKLDDIKTREISSERVTAQLTQKLTSLVDSVDNRKEELQRAVAEAKSSFQNAAVLGRKYCDPFQRSGTSSLPSALSYSGPSNSHVLMELTSREYGGGGSWRQILPTRRLIGRTPSRMTVSLARKAVLSNRLSHAVTINAHLAYPVYCLRFDRTGRYFVTGADDYLVKLFCLGPGRSCDLGREGDGRRQEKCNYGANSRGAVLVCTLRGHAGVICDIDVSADNAFLATASDDGDCRIWGLRDGCPVAILRGHVGGANMVSWSAVCPYRLATIGSDGLARMWDIREAALKRYGAQVGKRLDYLLPLTDAEKLIDKEELSSEVTTENYQSHSASEPVFLPPLPVRANEPPIEPAAMDIGVVSPGGHRESDQLYVPPLPQGVNHGSIQDAVGGNGGSAPVEGAFVANDAIDEGVRLIAKLQHGDIVSQQGPSTRSSRKAIKVICVARCPLGGHFVTGSDDGLGRIWADEDDDRINIIDQRYIDQKAVCCRKDTLGGHATRKSARVSSSQQRYSDSEVPSTSRLLATLAGHVNSITDLHYSNAGDRILTASQRDGVVRVWSWGSESGEHTNQSTASVGAVGGKKFSDLRQILIRLTNPTMTASDSKTQSSRRRNGTTASSSCPNPSCDVAVWTSDDSKIVTSQSCSGEGSRILSGSQFLLIWDSHNGQCLMGISEAHSETCSVVVPHPTDSSILCSAGADGRVNLWDLGGGECILTHQNTVDYGPVEPISDRGKRSGYLDGSFCPDGLGLILTDDNGRITVFDLNDPFVGEGAEDVRLKAPWNNLIGARNSIPSWMKEQYFANDYYELYYDTTGYCIERGSQQPPYLAPRAARCSHSGEPYFDDSLRYFRSLIGPLPLPEEECRWQRESTRFKANKLRRGGGPLFHNVQDKRAVVMGEFDPGRTVVVNGTDGELRTPNVREKEQTGVAVAGGRPAPTQTNDSRGAGERNLASGGRPLSSNYRWRDYDDILREEEARGDDADTDDEEFEPGRRMAVTSDSDNASSPNSLDHELSDEDSLSDRRLRRRDRSSLGRETESRSRRHRRRRRSRDRSVAFEQLARSQPTRVSARQLLRETPRGPYQEPDSDEDMVEFLSTNNTPSGPHIEDYTVAGHYFRMPDSGLLRRNWLCRLDNRSSYSGTKAYAPQVGDSVVYIPRAHYQTIQEFPTLEAPWKSWPQRSAWPIVRCRVRDIRYRFPYESYYRSSRASQARCISVVAILTLEVTGIPVLSQDRLFPWPKPSFVPLPATRSSNSLFEVSVFDGVSVEFVIPERLYIWRVESLEAAIGELPEKAMNGLRVVTYFIPETPNLGEDPDMVPYRARLRNKADPSEEGRDMHIHGSGYESLEIEWETGNEGPLLVSPWDLVVLGRERQVPPPPCMDEEEKNEVLKLLNVVSRREDAREWFNEPVNTVRYSDYLNRIEVPMDFNFIRSRVEADYYANRLSVLSDAKLVRDNCIKYNDVGNEVSDSAIEIYQFLEQEIGKIEETTAAPPTTDTVRPLHSSNESSPYVGQGEEVVSQPSARRTRGQTRRAGRGRSLRRLSSGLDATSSLELLPPPTVAGGTSQNGELAGSSSDRRRMTRLRRRSDGTSENASLATMTTRSRIVPAGTERRSGGGISHSEDDNYNKETSSEGESVSKGSIDGSDASLTGVGDSYNGSEGAESPEPSRRSSRLNLTTHGASPRVSPRRRRLVSSYVEVDSDAGMSPEAEESPEEPSESEGDDNIGGHSLGVVSRRTSPRVSVKRRRDGDAPSKGRGKRRKVVKTSDTAIPELKPWPDIDLKQITDVATAVMERMMESDADGVFAVPVAETYPEAADQYLEAVDHPMDYRTIVEDRIPTYQSIRELQDDLILVFRNCTTYNRARSLLWSYAITMWEMTNEVFRDVCKELDILLPRRW